MNHAAIVSLGRSRRAQRLMDAMASINPKAPVLIPSIFSARGKFSRTPRTPAFEFAPSVIPIEAPEQAYHRDPMSCP